MIRSDLMRIPSRAAYRFAVAGLVGLVALSSAPATSRAADVPPEKTVPASTVVFFKVANADALRASIKKSQFGRLIDDPEMKPIKDDVAAKLEETSSKLKEKVGVTLGELLTLPKGAVSIALIAKEDAKNPAALFLSADAGANAEKMAEVLKRSTDLAKKDAEVTTEKFKDSTLTVIRSKKEDEKDNPPLVWTQQGNVFSIASDIAVLKDVLSNAQGREDSLASKDSYNLVVKKLGPESQLVLYGDVTQILKLVAQAGGGGNAGQIEAQLQLTGLNTLKAVGFSAAFGAQDFDSLVKAYIYAPGPAQGLMKIFSLPKTALRPQPWVPAGVSSYQTVSWDFTAAYNAINELADMIAPGMLDNLQKSIGGPDGNGLDFKKDVIAPLANRVTVVSDVKKSDAAAKADAQEIPQRTVVAVALKDVKTFQGSFQKILALLDNAPKKREFQGTTIYDFELPDLPVAGANAAKLDGPLSVAIAKDNLFVTTDTTLLEQILRGGGQGLAESPAFQSVAKFYPAQSSTLSFQRPEDQAKAFYDMVKSGQFKKAIDEAAKNAPKDPNGGDAPKVPDLIDTAKLPDFSVFAKYLAPGGGFGVGDEDGMTFTQFTIKKAAP